MDAASQVWGRPPGWSTEGLGNRPVLQYLKDSFKLSSCCPSLHQIILRDRLFISSKRALFPTVASCCDQPLMRCFHRSHVDDCITSSLEVTSYKFFWTKAPTFSKLPARQRGICVNRLVHSQPSVCISGDPTKFLS